MDSVLPRAGATLFAKLHRHGDSCGPTPFIVDEHDDYWSIIAGYDAPTLPVQKHTSDGWVAAVFHSVEGFLKIVKVGEVFTMRSGGSLVSRVYRRGVRWEFVDPPG